MTNLYLVTTGSAYRFAVGKDRAESLYDSLQAAPFDDVSVYYITTLTECTADFS